MFRKIICKIIGHKTPYIETPWSTSCSRCRLKLRSKTIKEWLNETHKKL